MPWAVLLGGCLSGTAILALIAKASSAPIDVNTVRLAFLPSIAALCFVPHVYCRPVIQTVPIPAWIAAAGHTVLATAILTVTCAVQLRIMDSSVATHPSGPPPADHPVIAQFVGWSALAVMAASCCERTRFAPLNGAVAAPIAIAVIALAWVTPPISRLLETPRADAHSATAGWYAVATGATAVSWLATRDQWHRYARRLTARRT